MFVRGPASEDAELWHRVHSRDVEGLVLHTGDHFHHAGRTHGRRLPADQADYPRHEGKDMRSITIGDLVRSAVDDAEPVRAQGLEPISELIRNQLLPSTVKACRNSEIPLAGDGYVVPGQ